MKISSNITLVALFLVTLGVAAHSQQGRWVEYPDIQFGSGTKLYDAGDNCVGYTYTNSGKIVCFDITSGEWNEINFQSSENFTNLIAGGNVILIFGDTYLVAYNGLTSNFDTLQFEGAPLSLTGPEQQRSYKVGKNLAMFVTDEKMYVFDAARDGWQEFDYTMPATFNGTGWYWIKNDYAAVILNCANGTPPTNIAYSLNRGEFTETPQGGFWLEEMLQMDYGFVGFYSTGTGDPSHIIGYSSMTGQFLVYNFSGDYEIGPGWINTSDYVESYTVFAMSARILITPGELVRYEMYGYNTESGNWSHMTMDIDPGESSEPGGWRIGGKFATCYINNEDLSRTLIFYNGFTEDFETFNPGINYYYSGLYLEGGTVYAMADSQNVWVHNIENGNSSLQPIDRLSFDNYVAGEDYVAFERWDYSDTSTVYFWQGQSNVWTTMDITYVASEAGASHVYSFVTSGYGDPIRGVFYSPIVNDVTLTTFDPGSWPTARTNKYLASTSYTGRSYLYDSRSGESFMFEGSIGADNLGVNCCVARKDNNNVLYGYSALTGTVAELQTTETPFAGHAVDYIGLAHESYSYTRYFAFNGYYGNWVELVPLANYVGEKCGARTAIVLRSTTIYAFDPEGGGTFVEEDIPQLPSSVSLSQNYPNPFNGTTIIGYSLSAKSDVTIIIFDILGRRVATLDQGRQGAGNYKVAWDSDEISSGVYYYRIKAGNISETKKMLLLK